MLTSKLIELFLDVFASELNQTTKTSLSRVGAIAFAILQTEYNSGQ